jgi:hemoglobin
MRHVRFAIGRAERDAWYRHMADAVLAADLPVELEARMLDYFAMAADHLVNAPG